MIQIGKLALGLMEVNCYFVRNQGSRECVVIDPGDRFKKIKNYIDENDLDVKAILLTHGHYDHIGQTKALKELTGAEIYIHALDKDKLVDPDKSLASFSYAKCEPAPADVLLQGGEVLHIAGMDIKVIHTPGHSSGGVCYIIENSIFCGDIIFCGGSYGRYDFYDGNFGKLCDSVNKILSIPGNFDIYPGHGESTSSQAERALNPLYKKV